ncbi:MAG: hypothetical protein ABH851_06270 [Methanobacteriota archaeon]
MDVTGTGEPLSKRQLEDLLEKINPNHIASIGVQIAKSNEDNRTRNIGLDLAVVAFQRASEEDLNKHLGIELAGEVKKLRDERIGAVKEDKALDRLKGRINLHELTEEQADDAQVGEVVPEPMDVSLRPAEGGAALGSSIDVFRDDPHLKPTESSQFQTKENPRVVSQPRSAGVNIIVYPGSTVNISGDVIGASDRAQATKNTGSGLTSISQEGSATASRTGHPAGGDEEVTPKKKTPARRRSSRKKSTPQTQEPVKRKSDDAAVGKKAQPEPVKKLHEAAKDAFGKRDFKGAAEAWEKISNTTGIQPHYLATAKFNLAFALSRLGDQQRRDKKFDEAHKTYDKAGKNLAEVRGMGEKAREEGGITDKNMQKLDSRIHNSRGCNYYGQYTSVEDMEARNPNLVVSARAECVQATVLDTENINATHNVYAMDTILGENEGQQNEARRTLIDQVAGLGERATHTMHWNAAVCNNQLGNHEARDASLDNAGEKLTEAQKKPKDDGHKKQLEAFGVKIEDYRKSHSPDADLEAGEQPEQPSLVSRANHYASELWNGRDNALQYCDSEGNWRRIQRVSRPTAEGSPPQPIFMWDCAQTVDDRVANIDWEAGNNNTIGTQEELENRLEEIFTQTDTGGVRRITYHTDLVGLDPQRILLYPQTTPPEEEADGGGKVLSFQEGEDEPGPTGAGTEEPAAEAAGPASGAPGEVAEEAPGEEAAETSAERNARLLRDGRIGDDGTIKTQKQGLEYMDPTRGDTYEPAVEPRLVYGRDEKDNRIHAVQWGVDGDLHEWVFEDNQLQDGAPPLGQDGHIITPEGVTPSRIGGMDQLAHIDETVEERNKRLVNEGKWHNHKIDEVIDYLEERTPAGVLIPEPRLHWWRETEGDRNCHVIQRDEQERYREWMLTPDQLDKDRPPLNSEGRVNARESEIVGEGTPEAGTIDAVRRRLQGPPGAAEEEEGPDDTPPGGSGGGPGPAPAGPVQGDPATARQEEPAVGRPPAPRVEEPPGEAPAKEGGPAAQRIIEPPRGGPAPADGGTTLVMGLPFPMEDELYISGRIVAFAQKVNARARQLIEQKADRAQLQALEAHWRRFVDENVVGFDCSWKTTVNEGRGTITGAHLLMDEEEHKGFAFPCFDLEDGTSVRAHDQVTNVWEDLTLEEDEDLGPLDEEEDAKPPEGGPTQKVADEGDLSELSDLLAEDEELPGDDPSEKGSPEGQEAAEEEFTLTPMDDGEEEDEEPSASSSPLDKESARGPIGGGQQEVAEEGDVEVPVTLTPIIEDYDDLPPEAAVGAAPQEPAAEGLIKQAGVKPPQNPFDIGLGSRLLARLGRGKERVQAADAVAQWFDGDQFKKVVSDSTAVAYGLCGRMRDGTADPLMLQRFNRDMIDGIGAPQGTGILQLEGHAQALGMSGDQFREAFFLEFARKMEVRYPKRDDLVEVVKQGNSAFDPIYAVRYVDRLGKEHALFWNGSTDFMDCPLDDQGKPTGGVVAAPGGYGKRELEKHIEDNIIGHGNIDFKGVRGPPEWI